MTGTEKPAGPPRPLPALDQENEPFWTGGADGKLLIARCGDCGNHVHPATDFCPRCEGRDVTPQPVSGRAKVFAFTINHRAWIPGLPVPYVLALVELDEQADIRLPTNIVGCPPEDVRVGMPVEVFFEQHEDIFVPLFRPVAQ